MKTGAALFTALALIIAVGTPPQPAFAADNIPLVCTDFLDEVSSFSSKLDLTSLDAEEDIDALDTEKFLSLYGEVDALGTVLGQEQLPNKDYRFPDNPIGKDINKDVTLYRIPLGGIGNAGLVIDLETETGHCHRYYYFMRDNDNNLTPIRGPVVDAYENEGALCENKGIKLAFVRYKGQQTLTVVSAGNKNAKQYLLFGFDQTGKANLICRVRPGMSSNSIDFEMDRLPN